MEQPQELIINMLNKILSLFKKGDSSLNSFERKILESAASELPSELAHILMARINSINLVQRINDGQEVNCFEMVQRKPILRSSHGFPTNLEEEVFADFTVCINGNTVCRGKLWLVNGVFFSIEYSDNPKYFANEDNFQVHVKVMYKQKK
ncbi:hypothetical protein N474_17165 [Pseudoalteromonas luteoviolacea CPMOR-2]|uniref:hypothetical protein n=1 Tax=Pseudoalteromonas luteoviolacea TaxID=43657 RepID=UPI0007B05820|nr:hypothetical protein [Pseudoalteromonas luteoviolacea]KZN54883.1 hypothetical protein N474_17165 [Pseudoalteromonas luteoviolacea CPMOR-2]